MPTKGGLTPYIVLRFLGVGFLFGIAFESYLVDYFSINLYIAFIAIDAFFLLIFFVLKSRIARFILFVIGVLFGIIVYQWAMPTNNSVLEHIDTNVRVEGTIVDVDTSEKTQKLTLSNLKLDEQSVEDRVLILSPLFPPRSYGDRVVLRCDLERPEPFNGFRYDRFLASKNIYATCYTRTSPFVIAEKTGNPATTFLLHSRAFLIHKIDVTFGEPHASLLAGLLLGEQRFSDTWQERFIKTGTTHIVAASGYNVAIVTFLAFGLLTYFGMRRPKAFALLLGAILCYVVLAGAEAAVVRAGVMGIIVLTAQQLGRKSTMTNVLLLTACIMLLINPFLLRDDVGFQLSMLSTIALIYVAPYLEKSFRFLPETFNIRESFTATVSATLVTLPLVVIQFGRVSLVSPIANLLILSVIPYAMAFGAFAVVIGFIFSPLGVIFAGPAWALLQLVLFVVELLSSIPYSSIMISL